MVKKLWLFVLIAGTFVSCQKEIKYDLGTGSGTGTGTGPGTGTSSGTSYIKAKLDGVPRTFNNYAMALRLNISTANSVFIAGQASAASTEGINFEVNGNAPIVAGTYTESGNPLFITGGEYLDASSAIWAAGLHPGSTHPLTITFSEITTTTAKGTFSGDVYDNSGLGVNKKSFTEGEFNLKF